MGESEAERYYESLEGAWSGKYRLTITDWKGLRKSLAPSGTKVKLVGPAVLGAMTGAMTMWTTLQRITGGSRTAYAHTTRVSKLGATLFESEEQIVLSTDGRGLQMSGSQRAWPRLTSPEPYGADGEIDETATRATYRIAWYGLQLIQRTEIVREGLKLWQHTPWSSAMVLLRRM